MSRKSSSLFVLLAALAPMAVHAQEGGAGAQDVIEVYRMPRAKDPVAPHYPASASMARKEGWVMLNLMVDTEGRPYEMHVLDHVGDEAFVRAAKRALEKTTFTPAKVGDRAVDGSATYMIRFQMENGSNGGRRSFGRLYRSFAKALDEQSRDEAAAALALLEEEDIHNNYEYAYLNLARFFFAQRYGTPTEQMKHLDRALGESLRQPELSSYLDEETVRPSRRTLLQLRLQNRHYGEALDTLALMAAKGDDEGVALFQEVREQLTAFRSTDEPYGVEGALAETGSWDIELFKDDFYLDEVTGTLHELKLRCERDYVFFPFEPERRYNLSEHAGECSLEVIGDPGTTFTLVQQ